VSTARRPRIRDLGEDSLVARLAALCPVAPGLKIGPGDDCAVIDRHGRGTLELLKTDTIVEGVHFLPDAPPRQIGWKALARVASDFAAMGGRPEHALVTLAISAERPVAWVENLYRGLRRCAERCACSIAGGETTSLPPDAPALISISALGTVARRRLVLRSGGKPGDILAVTGRLGGSLESGRHLRFDPRIEEAAWLVEASSRRPRAMMDISDGLAMDLPRLARASGCGFELDPSSIPRHRGCSLGQALGDGEDYELLMAVSPEKWNRLAADWPERFPRIPLSAIGKFTEKSAGMPDLKGGWEHFAHR